MTNEVKKVPELRFPEFNGGWEGIFLNKLGVFKKNYTFSRANEGDGTLRHIHYGDIHSKFKSKIEKIELLPSISVDIEHPQLVQNNDLIFADASEDYDDLGKAILMKVNNGNVIAGLHTHLFSPNNNLNSEFLLYFTQTKVYRKFIKRQGVGISVLGISKKNLDKLLVNLPNYNEQQKIGEFFSKLDRQIELEEQKLTKLEEQKKGYMQKIFSQELRFKDENGNEYPEWEVKKLEDVASKVKSKNKDNKYAETLTNSAELGIISQRDYFDKDISNSKSLGNYYIVEKDDFVYNPRISNYAPVGPINRNKLNRTGIMSPLYTVFKTKGIDERFLEYYFKTTKWHKFMKLNGDSGARSDRFTIKIDLFMKMPVLFPNYEEQIKIGHFLEEMEKLIKQQSSKVELFKRRKQGLLQKMFI